MKWDSPLLRPFVVLVAIAAAIRLAWLLIEPVLPALAVAVVAFVLWRLVSWYRDERW